MTPGPERRYPGRLLRTSSDYSWRLLVLGALLYFAVRLLSHLAIAFIPFIVALLVTALLRPVLVWLRRRGVPRGLATIASLLLAVVVVGGVVTLVVLGAIDQAPQLGGQINRLIPHVKNWLETGPLHLNRSTVNNFSQTLTRDVNNNSSAIASTALSTGKTVLDLIAGFLLAIFITVFLLFDGEGVWEFAVKVLPGSARPHADRAGRAAWYTLGHYVRGALVVAVFHGVVIAIALEILRVPLVLPLAVLVGLGSFVPLVGAVITGALAAAIALIEKGTVAGIAVVGVLLVDNQIEAHLLQPFVVGRYVRIHPLATVLALAVGAILFGIFGAIIAVPTVACVNSAVRGVLEVPEPEKAMDPAATLDEPPPDPDGSEKSVQ